MKALAIEGVGRLTVVEVPEDRPGPGEVSIALSKGGICGTDLHLFAGRLPNLLPLVPGHDLAGVVTEVGEGVDDSRRGTRVTVDPASCCSRAAVATSLCPQCGRGATHLCEHRTYLGMTAGGGFRERMVVPAARAVPLPAEIDDEAATALEPVAVALHLEEKLADRPGAVLVVGGGPVGVVAAVHLASTGRAVTLVEPIAGRRRLAEAWGLDDVRPPDELSEAWPVVVEASGHPATATTVLTAAVPGATIVLVGGPIELPGVEILTRELEVRAVKGGRGLYPEAVDRVLAGGLPVGQLVSHRFDAADGAHAFRTMSERPAGMRAVLDLTRWGS